MSETGPPDAGDRRDAAADGADHEALAAAIAEDPEAVAEFVDRLDLVNDLLDATDLAVAAADDETVERLAGRSARLAASADGLATEETAALAETVGENADDLDSALETLLRLERAGTLEDLAALADAASLATAAMDDGMAQRLAATGASLGEVADAAGDPDTVRGLETVLRGTGEAAGADPAEVGVLGLLRALRDPEVKRGMGFLVALARGVGAAEAERA